ncbi:uncharacterized protein [Heterodontus francisci]|uniref:uncharacterized protein n=1 Tax=Heterodontus francisci TaxID=7792 RepID=UPI00355C98FD
MHFATLTFLLAHLRAPAVAGEPVSAAVEAAEGRRAVAAGSGKPELGGGARAAAPLTPTPLTPTATAGLPTSSPIVLMGSTQIAVSGPGHPGEEAAAAAPVSVGSGAELIVVNSNGTEADSSVPIVLRPGDEIIIAGSDTVRSDGGHPAVPGGRAEIIITDAGNATFAPIVLEEGDEIVVADSSGVEAVAAASASIVLGNRTEIKVAGSGAGKFPIFLSDGTELVAEHYSEGDEVDGPIATLAESPASASVTRGEAPAAAGSQSAEAAKGLTLPPSPMAVVISLDNSSYTWAMWSPWYCNCLNSSMSRIRGIMDKDTGIVLHYKDYQPSYFQRQPCSYEMCECSREDKQCHLANVTCLEPNPYNCVLNDIAYQEIMDSKDYWKKLKKGVQALYYKIKTFLKKNANEET